MVLKDDSVSGISDLFTLVWDLAAVSAFVVVVAVLFTVPSLPRTQANIPLSFVYLVFAPGYAVISAFFPRGTEDEASRDAAGRLERGIGAVERFILSVGMSLVVVSLLALAVSTAGYGVRLVPVLVAVSTFTVCSSIVAAFRRSHTPAEHRYVPPLPVDRLSALVRGQRSVESATERTLNVLLLFSILLAGTGVVYATTTSSLSDGSTEFYLLTENETGALTAEEFPTTFRDGESHTYVVGVSNHEGRQVEYTVIAQIQRIGSRGGDSVVASRAELDRFQVSVSDGGKQLYSHTVSPDAQGTDLRLVYLLYSGSVPNNPNRNNAHEVLQLNITVTESPTPNGTAEDSTDTPSLSGSTTRKVTSN